MSSTAATLPSPAARPLASVGAQSWIMLAIFVVLALQGAQVFTRAINWDEFGHYNHLVQLNAGTLPQVLQRGHAFAFAWVPGLPGNNLDHIMVIRLFMLACEVVSLAAIVGIASRFADRTTALLCALAWVSFSYVFQHGASFRYDPPITALLLTTLWIIARSELGWRAVFGGAVLIALMPLVTVKAVLYAPGFAAVVWWRWCEHGRSLGYILRLAALSVLALVLCAVLLTGLGQFVAETPGRGGGAFLSRAAEGTFALFANPNGLPLALGLARNPVVIALLAFAPFAIARSPRPLPEKIALAGLFLPVLTPLFYVNTAPYFFVFLLPPLLIASVDGLSYAATRFGPARMALVLALFPLLTIATEEPSALPSQRQLRAAAEETFGDDIAYIDFPGVLGTSGKANAFMSPLVVQNRQREGELLIRPVLEATPVPLVINNHFILESALETDEDEYLMPPDLAALRDNYVPFWGPFWLAGQEVPTGSGEFRFETLVPGPYTVQGAALVVDGRPVEPGEVVQITRGAHVIGGNRIAASRLLWGENLSPPTYNPPPEPHFTPF